MGSADCSPADPRGPTRAGLPRQPSSRLLMIGFGARTFLACVLVLAGSARLSAQTTSGSIVGVVTHATGAAVFQASVTVTNLDTGIASKFVTDPTGTYVATPRSIVLHS